MKKIFILALLSVMAVHGWSQMSQIVSIDGTSNGKFVTNMTFNGDNVTVNYDGGTSETLEASALAIDCSYAVSLSQSDSQGNSDKLAIYGGRVVNVNVARTVKNSFWAPVCFPFSMTEEQITAAFGEGARVTRLDKATAKTINFSRVSSITAGEPYLVRLPEGAADITSFSLQDIALSNITEGATLSGEAYAMTGTIPTTTLTGDNYYYFTTSNTMRPLISGNNILPLRGYMQSLDGASGANDVVFSIDGQTTGIASITADGVEVNEGDIYHISGQRVGNRQGSLHKGVYIINGKKVIIK